MAKVTFKNLEKTFTDPQSKKTVKAVNDLDLEIRDGEFLVLVGPSGCGKSTALRMLAGLEESTGGEIFIGDKVVNDLPPGDRNIAMVFQNYALYPHMTVYDNMAFGLRERRLPSFWRQWANSGETRRIKTEIDHQVTETAELLGITQLLDRKPKALSGGQRQRVALGRAIVRHPEVFLMDEPLSNLDAKLRVQTRAELIKLHRRLGVTTIYVTHDQVEALTMGQRIAVMKDGVLQQCDVPLEIYHHPANMFVAGFIGTPSMNFLRATVREVAAGERPLLDFEAFQVRLPERWSSALQSYVGKTLIFGIRPEDVHDQELTPPSAADRENLVDFEVDVVEPMGSTSVLYLKKGGQSVQAQVNAATKAVEGGTLRVVIDTGAAHVFDVETEVAIV